MALEQKIADALRGDKRDPATLTPREAVALKSSRSAVDNIYVDYVHRSWLKRQSRRQRVWWWLRLKFWTWRDK